MLKFFWRAISLMRSLVSALINGLSFKARETVDLETFARRAISARVRVCLSFMLLQPVALYNIVPLDVKRQISVIRRD